MIFQFYQLFRSIKEVFDEPTANKIFPEYATLPDTMSATEQVELANLLMNRLDTSFDRNTVIKIRQRHPCNIPKLDKQKIEEIKQKFDTITDRISAYSNYLGGTYSLCGNNEYTFSWGNKKCVCSMFRKLDEYKTISSSWCECCNANNKLQFSYLCDTPIDSKLLQGICCGGTDCSFKITILQKQVQ